jgi:ribosome-associated translation inhibitor RaiA
MVTLDAGNVLLKPTHKRQLMSRLKRITRLGDRLGNFIMRLSLRRTGRHVEMTAKVHDRFGDFALRSRAQSWTDALHAIVHAMRCELRSHSLRRAAYAVV